MKADHLNLLTLIRKAYSTAKNKQAGSVVALIIIPMIVFGTNTKKRRKLRATSRQLIEFIARAAHAQLSLSMAQLTTDMVVNDLKIFIISYMEMTLIN